METDEGVLETSPIYFMQDWSRTLEEMEQDHRTQVAQNQRAWPSSAAHSHDTGGIPRLLFVTLFSDGDWAKNVKEYEKRVAEQSAVLVKRVPEAVFGAFFNEGASHSVVALRPENATAAVGKRKISTEREMTIVRDEVSAVQSRPSSAFPEFNLGKSHIGMSN
jgi:hypothetical protein